MESDEPVSREEAATQQLLKLDQSAMQSLIDSSAGPFGLGKLLLSLRTSRIRSGREAEALDAVLEARNQALGIYLGINLHRFEAEQRLESAHALKGIRKKEFEVLSEWYRGAYVLLESELRSTRTEIQDEKLRDEACSRIVQLFYRELQLLEEDIGTA